MAKGGGQAATQTTIQDVPEWAKPSYQRLLSATEGQIFDITKGPEGQEQIAFRPYQAYEGQRLTPTGADVRTSQEMIRGIAGQPIAGLGQAQGILGGLAQQAGQLGAQRPGEFAQTRAAPYSQFAAFTPSQFGQFQERGGAEFAFDPARQFSGQEVGSYMSPYMQQVVQRQQEDARLQFERGRAGRAAQAVEAGAFGGSRQAVQEALAEEALGRQLGDIQATGLQSAYEQAAQRFESDRAAQMALQQQRAAEAARVQGIGVGEAGRVQAARAAELARTQGMTAEELARVQQAQAAELARTQGIDVQEAARVQQARADEAMRQRQFELQTMGFSADAARQLADLGERARAGDIQAAQLLEAQGLGEMAREQAGLDIAYQDFLRQQEFPFEQLSRFSANLRGLPVAPAGTATTYQPTPSAAQQAFGTGISLLGLYRGLQ